MTKLPRWLFFISSITFITFAYACSSAKPPMLSDESITVEQDESFDIRLSAQMGTGYSWHWVDADKADMVRLDASLLETPSENDEADSIQIFRFTGLKKGDAVLYFVYKQPWRTEQEPAEERRFYIVIK